jgi:hypothetical protein
MVLILLLCWQSAGFSCGKGYKTNGLSSINELKAFQYNDIDVILGE